MKIEDKFQNLDKKTGNPSSEMRKDSSGQYMSKGLEITFRSDLKPESKSSKRGSETSKSQSLEEKTTDQFFPKMEKHYLRDNERGAFRSLVRGSGVSWEELASKNISPEDQEEIKKIAQQYVQVYLSAHPDVDLMKGCYRKLKEIMKEKGEESEKLEKAA